MLATAALAGASASAQAPLGTVSNVQGVVTATLATQVTVAPGTAIQCLSQIHDSRWKVVSDYVRP